MAVPPFSVDETLPKSADLVSAHPTDERSARDNLESMLNIEHDFVGGRHFFGVGNDAARDAITTWVIGSLWLNTVTSPVTLQRAVSIDPDVWEDVREFAAGTVMLFQQTAAPTGWTKQTTHNDKALRVVSGTAGSAGATAFTSVFGVSKLTGAHTLAIAEIPAHSHSGVLSSSVSAEGGVNARSYNQARVNTGLTGGGGSHTHTLSLDLQYVDVIIASKD